LKGDKKELIELSTAAGSELDEKTLDYMRKLNARAKVVFLLDPLKRGHIRPLEWEDLDEKGGYIHCPECDKRIYLNFAERGKGYGGTCDRCDSMWIVTKLLNEEFYCIWKATPLVKSDSGK